MITAIIFSCKKPQTTYEQLTLMEIIPGGCAIDGTKSLKDALEAESDTVSFTVIDNNLDIFVGFNATCCGEYLSSALILNDTIFIDIETTQEGLCNCICYYTYNFKFLRMLKSYSYIVRLDDITKFSGLINP
jgi:hypothetical protein